MKKHQLENLLVEKPFETSRFMALLSGDQVVVSADRVPGQIRVRALGEREIRQFRIVGWFGKESNVSAFEVGSKAWKPFRQVSRERGSQ